MDNSRSHLSEYEQRVADRLRKTAADNRVHLDIYKQSDPVDAGQQRLDGYP